MAARDRAAIKMATIETTRGTLPQVRELARRARTELLARVRR
jgi:uncharacterized protein (DUF305 family)